MRKKIQHLFHGGCHGCENDISVCPMCQYMEADWDKPDLNTQNTKDKKVHGKMVRLAKQLHISTEWIL